MSHSPCPEMGTDLECEKSLCSISTEGWGAQKRRSSCRNRRIHTLGVLPCTVCPPFPFSVPFPLQLESCGTFQLGEAPAEHRECAPGATENPLGTGIHPACLAEPEFLALKANPSAHHPSENAGDFSKVPSSLRWFVHSECVANGH